MPARQQSVLEKTLVGCRVVLPATCPNLSSASSCLTSLASFMYVLLTSLLCALLRCVRFARCSQDGDPGSWPDMAPRLMSGRTTPTMRVPGGRGSIIAGALVTPSTGGTAAGELVQQRQPAAGLTPEASSSSSAGGSGLAAGSSYSSSTVGSRRQSAAGVGASAPSAAGLSPAGAAVAAVAQEQLLRMQEAWRESVEKDVICLREVLGQYKEQVERLDMQKKLLLSQVGAGLHAAAMQSSSGLAQLAAAPVMCAAAVT